MYDLVQTALTATIEAIALVAFVGLPAHYIITSHVQEVRSWGTPQATPAPHVEVESEIKSNVEVEPELKPSKNRSKKASRKTFPAFMQQCLVEV